MRKHKPKCNINTLENYLFSLCMLAEYPLPYEEHLWPKYATLRKKDPENTMMYLNEFLTEFKQKRTLKLHKKMGYRTEHPCEYLFSDVFFQLISYIEVTIEVEQKKKMKSKDVLNMNVYFLLDNCEDFYRNEENEDIHLWWYDIYYGTYAHEGHVIYYTIFDIVREQIWEGIYLRLNKLLGTTYVLKKKI